MKLKPCPFCGSDAVLKDKGGEYGMVDYNAIVGCSDTKDCGVNVYRSTFKEAILHWNMRKRKKEVKASDEVKGEN